MSMAWTEDGLVTKVADTPFKAMRKCFLTYKNNVTAITKLTINKMDYDFARQASEGVVVCGYHYDSLTWFLPDNREPMPTEKARTMSNENPETMTLKSYFEMLATSDYANIPSWNRFAIHFADVLVRKGVANTTMSFTMTTNNSNYTDTESGKITFNGNMTTANELFESIANALSDGSNVPLAHWMAEDGAIVFKLIITAYSYSVTVNMTIGRK